MKKILLVIFLGIGILSNVNAMSASGFKSAKKACDNNIGKGCAAVGAAYAYGLGGVSPDMEKAKYFWKKGCVELDNASSCTTYSNTLTDTTERISVLEKACKLGNENGCIALRQLKQIIKDEQSCNSGDSKACKKIAEGLVLNLQFDLAKNFLDLSCKAGDKQSCDDIVQISETTYDNLNIVRLAKEKCYAGDQETCFSTGTYYVELMKITKDKEKILSSMMTALVLYKKGCESGKKEACKVAENIEGILYEKK